MNSYQTFRCAECGDTVRLTTGIRRTYEQVRDHKVSMPDDFEITKCPSYGEIYILPETEEIWKNKGVD